MTSEVILFALIAVKNGDLIYFEIFHTSLTLKLLRRKITKREDDCDELLMALLIIHVKETVRGKFFSHKYAKVKEKEKCFGKLITILLY